MATKDALNYQRTSSIRFLNPRKHPRNSFIMNEKQAALSGRRATEPIHYSLFFRWIKVKLSQARGYVSKQPYMLENPKQGFFLLMWVSTLAVQRRKCCELKLTFLMQKHRKCRQRWWLGNYKLSIACGFHILGIFEVSNFENVYCCQRWPQIWSIWYKCWFFWFYCVHAPSYTYRVMVQVVVVWLSQMKPETCFFFYLASNNLIYDCY